MGGADVARGGEGLAGRDGSGAGGGATIWPRVRLVLFVHRENCVRCTFVDFATCLRVRPHGPLFCGQSAVSLVPPSKRPPSLPSQPKGQGELNS